MPEAHTAKVSLSFAKLVATPTEIAWSQAYNAGNLFACLSLNVAEEDEEVSLHAIGKDLFNVLQSEFFTLPEKNTEHIKTAIRTSLESVPQNVTYSLTLAFFNEATLLVFIAGSGTIVIKRGDKIGTLLTKQEEGDEVVTSAAGYVQHADTIILETGQFAQGIAKETVTQALELTLPTDIVEALSPQIHQQDNGAQAAIVIGYIGSSAVLPAEPEPEEQQSEEEQTVGSLYHQKETEQTTEATEEFGQEEPIEHKRKLPAFKLPRFSHFPLKFKFDHRRRLYFNIAIILAVLLLLSIFFTIKKYNDDKQKALFQSIYPTAQQYYSEGQGLASVNPSLSQDSYQKAEKLLQDGQSKFSKSSSQRAKIDDLLAKVENGLQNSTGQSTNATAVEAPSHSLLSVEQSTHDGFAYGQDDTDVYVVTSKAITKVSKSDGTTTDIIKNNSYWSTPVAVVPYQGNVYVLDPQKGLLKFVPSGSGFGKANYFNDSTPDLSSATGMAIDGSVWIVLKDGTILNYLKGKSTGLTVSGLTKSLSNPSKIETDVTMENVYVLDNGNSRIVAFDKNLKYQNAFSASAIATAKDFDISEKNKKALFFSSSKVWQISM